MDNTVLILLIILLIVLGIFGAVYLNTNSISKTASATRNIPNYATGGGCGR